MHEKQTNSVISEKGKTFKALSFAKVFTVLGTQIWIFGGGGVVVGEVHFNQIKILIKNNNKKLFNCFQPYLRV